MAKARIPVTLVTGFLGSGKTTFLLRLAERNPQKKLLFLVNEFARQSVDGTTLSLTNVPVHSVVGGSLFCECKAGDFVRLMREHVTALHEAKTVDQVVIETSGIADPSAIGELMQEHGLSESFQIQQIVNIVAPARFPQLHENLTSVQAQVQACDVLIINQTDLATPAQIQETRSLVQQANPRTQVMEAEHCRLDFNLNGLRPTDSLPSAPLHECDANPFTTKTVKIRHTPSVGALRSWLEALPSEILRVKGHVQTAEGWREIQRTVSTAIIKPCDPTREARVVIIAHDDHESHLDDAVRQLRALSA